MYTDRENNPEIVFKQTIKERRGEASGASKKRCGAKSKKCALPHDRISRKRWEQMNGEIKTVKMDQPILWDDFKSLSKDLQVEYLENLKSTFNASIERIARMMGVTASCIRNWKRSHDVSVKFPLGNKMASKEDRELWNLFLTEANWPLKDAYFRIPAAQAQPDQEPEKTAQIPAPANAKAQPQETAAAPKPEIQEPIVVNQTATAMANTIEITVGKIEQVTYLLGFIKDMRIEYPIKITLKDN